MNFDKCFLDECTKKAKVLCKCENLPICSKHIADHLCLSGRQHSIENLSVELSHATKSYLLEKLLSHIKDLSSLQISLQQGAKLMIEKILTENNSIQENISAQKSKYYAVIRHITNLKEVRKTSENFYEKLLCKQLEDMQHVCSQLRIPVIKFLINAEKKIFSYESCEFEKQNLEKIEKFELIGHLEQLNHKHSLKKYSQSIKDNQATCQMLLEIVQESSKKPELGVAASRALAVLSHLEYDFSSLDLSSITVPNLELSGGTFISTDFSNADFSGAKLSYPLLSSAKCNFSLLSSIEKGKSCFIGHSKPITCLKFSKDYSLLASGSEDFMIRIWELNTGHCLSILESHSGPVLDIDISNDSCKMISGSQDNTVKIWNIQMGIPIMSFNEHLAPVNCVSFSPDSQLFISGSLDKAIIIRSSSGEVFQKILSQSPVSCFTLPIELNDENTFSLLYGTSTGDLKFWKLQGKKPIWEQNAAHSCLVSSILATKAPMYIYSSGSDGVVKTWSSYRGKKISKIFNPKNVVCMQETVTSAGFCRLLGRINMNYLISWGKDGEIKLLEGENKEVRAIYSSGLVLSAADVSTNLSWLALAHEEKIFIFSCFQAFSKDFYLS